MSPVQPRHARPRPPLRDRLALTPVLSGVIAVIAMATTVAVGLSRDADETPADSQGPGATPTTSAATAALSGSQVCERHVTQALARYAQAKTRGRDAVLAAGDETTRLTPLELEAFTMVLSTFDTRMADSSRRQGLAEVITSVMPGVRRVCAQAG